MNNWINAIFNAGRMQPFLNMFGRKRRRNRGMLWGSLISLGLSAAAYGFTRNRGRNMARPFQNLMNNTAQMTNFQKPNMAGLTEFAEELTSNKNQINNKFNNSAQMTNFQKPNMAGVTEFAKELTSNKNQTNNK
ncbi:hypothetical protein [Cytobacillus firmus]|uniref:hypothetical protein n=1 Tax=Cytobacillus firmus TaxID=1399 RepID=UPI001C8E00A2|nr:hypothetical protein [Cytobacillus firmus]MBX9973797.1 hypothetical protein [Cytobacillus firmus]